MKITTMIAAAALATASTVAVAGTVDVMTADGEIVMIEKNQASLAFLATLGPAAFAAVIAAVTIASGNGTE